MSEEKQKLGNQINFQKILADVWLYNHVPSSVSTSPTIFEVGPVDTHSFYFLKLVKQYLVSSKMYIWSMNGELSDDIKKFMLPLTIELHDSKQKVFHNTQVSTNL